MKRFSVVIVAVVVMASCLSVDAAVVALKRSPGLTDGQGISSSFSTAIANGTITVYSGQGSVADTFIYNNTSWAQDLCYANSGAAPIVSQQGLIVLAKFGVSQLPGFAGGTVNKAQLRFYCPGGNSGVSNTGYITSSDWSEGNKVGPGLWGYPGDYPGLAAAAPGASGAHPNGINTGSYQNADGTPGTGLPASWANNQVFSPSKDGVSSGSFVSQTSINNYTGLYVTLDITAMVQSWANGTPNYGLYIGNCGNYSFYMSEETGSADYQPILFIDYVAPDVIPPAPISTLAVGAVTKNGVQLSWTATGDDGSVGTTSRYDLRYSTSLITDMASFNAATAVSGLPAPQTAGSAETFTVTGLAAGTTYYFAVVAYDRGNNCSGLSDVAIATTRADTSPTAVADLASPASGRQHNSIQLTWMATGDDGSVGTASRYDLRYSTSPISDMASFNAATPVAGLPAPKASGSAESFIVTGLSPSTTYNFALVVYDSVNQPSGLSNVVTATTAADTPPTTVVDLTSPGAGRLHNSIRLTWTASGDDGSVGTAGRYDLRYSTGTISDMTSFNAATPVSGVPAPKIAGSAETFTVTSLNPSTTYNFALVVYDAANQASGLSNVVVASTCWDTPPAAVTDLSAPAKGATVYTIQLTWTASGEDGSVGTAGRYDLRYSTGTIGDMTSFNAATPVSGVLAPRAAGSIETFTVTGLTMNTTYNFALVVYDAGNQVSGLSNVVVATTLKPSDGLIPVLVQSIPASSLPSPSPEPSWNGSGTYMVYAKAITSYGQYVYVMSGPNGYYIWFQRDMVTGQLAFGGATEMHVHAMTGYAPMRLEMRTLASGSPMLYAGLDWEYNQNAETWLSIDPATGSLTQSGILVSPWTIGTGGTGGWPWTPATTYGYTDINWNADCSRVYRAYVGGIQWVNFQADGTPVLGGTSPIHTDWSGTGSVGGRPEMGILCSPDGKHAYVTTCTASNTFVVDCYSVNNTTGAVTYLSTLLLPGYDWIRNLAFTPDSRYLFIGTHTSSSGQGIATMSRDSTTGALTLVQISTDPKINGLNVAPWNEGDFKLNADGLSGYFTTGGYTDGASSTLYPFSIDPATGAITIYNGIVGTGLSFALDNVNGYLYYGQNPLNVYRTPARDAVPPGAVTDLAAPSAGTQRNSVQLTWTATGNDGTVGTAGGYDLRYSTSCITDMTSFNTATRVTGLPGPKASGQAETFTVNGLAASTTYYFAIVVYDATGNASGLSNVASATTLVDTPPAAITDLAAAPLPNGIKRTSIQLIWTATGDDGSYGTASRYDLRYSTSPITDMTSFNAATQAAGLPAPKSAGSRETFTVTGLSGQTTYYFAMVVYDGVNNTSGVSNVCIAGTRKLGDIDGDGQVNLADLKLLVVAWNSQGGGAYGNWNPDADLDGDNNVNLSDLKILVAHWNQ